MYRLTMFFTRGQSMEVLTDKTEFESIKKSIEDNKDWYNMKTTTSEFLINLREVNLIHIEETKEGE